MATNTITHNGGHRKNDARPQWHVNWIPSTKATAIIQPISKYPQIKEETTIKFCQYFEMSDQNMIYLSDL